MDNFHLYSNWISHEEAAVFMQEIYKNPWKTLNGRRVQQFSSLLTPQSSPIPQFLETLAEKVSLQVEEVLEKYKGKVLNHVLVNEYKPGEGILAHTDGLKYEAVVATISLAGSCILKFTPRNPSDDAFQVWIPQNSLYIHHDSCYLDYLHAVEASPSDTLTNSVHLVPPNLLGKEIQRTLRVSVTFRIVQGQKMGKGITSLLKNLQ
jgi:alkylated DNA repair protein alkB family protein 6